MDRPLVTVITPSYNQGQFIRATIESVLSQDYPHIEYLIRDGGSTDETAAVARDYSSRLTFISEKDRGQSDAINKGFQQARGAIVSWLNSDDLYLPGAIRRAVERFQGKPNAGAVYGEGFLIDREGRISSRFPFTEPPNLWKLVHLSDYILQQTVYFRKAVLDNIGYLDENLHYTMDWDILIRIATKYPIEYIPEYMGCLREYPEAKSFTGGKRRVRELHRLLQRHTGMRMPPGSIVYGLDTYQRICCAGLGRLFPRKCRPVCEKLEAFIRLGAGTIINRTIQHSQGLYADGWAGPVMRYMLAPNHGPVLIEGYVPEWNGGFRRQTVFVEANGKALGAYSLPVGEFQLEVGLPAELHGQLLHMKIRASRYAVPARFCMRGDHRRLAYQLKSIRSVEPAAAPDSLIELGSALRTRAAATR
jgi:Glycosyl transferase family 2